MKKVLFAMLLVMAWLLPGVVKAQTYDTIVVGTGTGSSRDVAFNSYYNNSWNEIRYGGSEIGRTGLIRSVGFNVATAASLATVDIKIYMGMASSLTFANSTDWTPESGLTLVYASSGETIGSATGWQRFELQSPFAYTDTSDALVVVVSRHGTAYSSALYWQCTSVSNQCLYRRSDSQGAGWENHPGTNSGTMPGNRANASFVMEDIPTGYCFPPTQVTLSNVASRSADLSWMPGGSESYYEVAVGEPGFSFDSVTINTCYATSYTLTNLQPNHTYQYAVRSVCSDNSIWRMGNFTTTCAEIETTDLPYYEDFSSYGSGTGVYPTCWTRSGNATTYISGGKLYVYAYSNGYSCYASMTPVSSTFDLTQHQVRFLAQKYYNSSSYQDVLVVGVMTDPLDGTTFVPVDTIPMTQALEEYEVSLSQYTGTGRYVTFKVVSNGYINTYIDDVYLEELPLCPRVTNPVVTNVTANEATISWNAPVDDNPNSYTVYYSTVNSFSDTCAYETVYDTTCTLTYLDPITTYYFWIISNCSAGNSNVRNGGSFTTLCSYASIPYNMGFEGLASQAANGSIPPCWTWLSGISNSNPCPHGAFQRTGSVSLSLYMNGSSTIAGMGNLIALPSFENLNTLALTFYAYQEQNNPCDVFVVGVMEGDTFVPYDTIQPAYDVYTEYTVPFDNYQGNGTQPAFRAYRASGAMHVYIDDITVDVIPDCLNPSNVHATALQSTEMTLAWTGDASASYEVYYDTTEVTDYTTLSAMDYATTNGITLTGLEPHTTYHIYVRTSCSAGYSNWTHGVVTTNRCDDMCNLTLTPTYSGYYWYYNNIDLYQDGEHIAALNYGNYGNGAQTVPVCPGDSIFVNWSATSTNYSTYIGFNIKDSWDNILYSLPEGTSLSNTNTTLAVLLTNCEAPECPAPRNLYTGAIDSANAWIHWEDSINTSWVVEYGPVGFTLGQGTSINCYDDSVQITGLAAQTQYQVYVKAVCSDTLMVSQPLTFRTGCGMVSMYPFVADFEGHSEGQVPQCWTQLANSGVNPCVSVASYVAHSGSCIISMWHNQNGQQNTIATPMFDDLSGKQLTFWARYNNGIPHFSVGVVDAYGVYVPMDTIVPATTYTEYTYDLTNWALEGNQIAFHTTCTAGSTQIVYIDDVVIDIMPDCIPLVELHTVPTQATTTSVTVAWTDTINSAWEYIIDSVAITNPGLYVATSASASPLTITGLNPATTYHVYVRPTCSGVTNWSHTVAATRVCDGGCDVEIVMHDSYGDGWNNCKILVSQNGITMGEATIASGNSNTEFIGICPNIPIQFNFQVGSYPSETSFEINDAWGNELYACSNGSTINGNFFNYTTNCQAPTCLAPRFLATAGVTSNAATITWFDTMASSWTLKYHTAPFSPDTVSAALTATVQDTFYTITGLAPQTTYYVYVQANCTDTNVWSNMFSFTTGCGELTSVPWTEDFEGLATTNQNGQFGDCWLVLQNHGSNPCPYGGYANSGSGSVSVYAAAGTNTFALPAFQSLTGLQFSFYGFMEAANPADVFTVGVIDANGAYVPMDTINLGNSYGYHVVTLDNYALIGNRVAISATRSNGTMHVYLDDFAIDSISNCLPVMNVTASNVTTNSAVLDWTDLTDSPNGYLVEYGRVGGTSTQTVFTTSHPYTLNGLTAASDYSFRVRVVCGGNDSSLWSSLGYFITECDLITISASDPYVQNFDGVTGTTYSTAGVLPNCWEGYSNGTNSVYEPHVVGSSTYWYCTSGNSLIMTSGASTYGSDKYVRLPQFTNPVNSLTMSFWMSTESRTDGTLSVGYFTNDTLGSSFVSVRDIPASDSTYHGLVTSGSGVDGHYDTVSFDSVPAGAMYIGFRWNYTSSFYSVCIDDVVVTSTGASCGRPTILNVTNDYANATVVWSGAGNNYEVEVKPVAQGAWNNNPTAVQGNTYTFTGLVPATAYQFRVRQDCDTIGYSDWAMGTFTTDSLPCFAPTAVAATHVEGTSVDLTWTAGGNETQWMVKVWNNTFADSVMANTTSTTVNGLVAATSYNAAVKAVCGNGATSSDWSEPITFTTATCAPVSDVQAGNITANSASISWTNNGVATQWEIEYGMAGFGQGEGTTITATANPTTITGLESELQYDVYVRAICGDNWVSEWATKVTFTTTAGGQQGIGNVEGMNVAIYPNPTSGATTISLSGVEGEVSLVIVDMSGRRVMSDKMECSSADCVKTINVENLAQGAYFVRIQGQNTNMVKKLIVK